MRFLCRVRMGWLWCLVVLLPVQALAINLNEQWSIYWDAPVHLQAADLYDSGQTWQPDARQGMNGYRPGVFWAQFKVPAVAEGHKGLLLSVGFPYLDRIEVYAWGESQPLAIMGDTVSTLLPRLSSTSHVMRLPVSTHDQRYLLRVQSTSAMNIRAQLLSDEELLQVRPESQSQFKAGVFITLYLLSAIMYMVGAAIMRQPVQLVYSLYLLCLLAIFFGVNQPILLNEWLGSPRWANWVAGVGILLIPAVGCLLWIVILRLRHTYPIIFRIYVAIAVLCVVSLCTINTSYYQHVAQMAVFGILLLSIFNLALALWCMRDPAQFRHVGMFVLALSMTTVTAVVNNLSVMGVITAQPWFSAAFDASSLIYVFFMTIATNLSSRKLEAENREHIFQKKLLVAQRDQVQSFSTFVAHELLTPLARMGRSAEMLARETGLTVREAKRVADIRMWAFETGKLAEAFLNSVSLKSGQVIVKPVQVDLSEWLQSMRAELDLNYPHCTLQWQLGDGAGSAMFDPLLAKVALENIVINAFKYAGTTNAVLIHLAVDDGSVVMIVNDQGPGLKYHQYDQVGQVVQLRQPIQDQPGFGLGLSLVAHIAQAHGGSFSASPCVPRGVRWVLRLGS